MNPWRDARRPLELNEVAELADDSDLSKERYVELRRPDFLIMEEIRSLRMAMAFYGLGVLMVSVASFGILLYAVME